jgi:hypothetical protein
VLSDRGHKPRPYGKEEVVFSVLQQAHQMDDDQVEPFIAHGQEEQQNDESERLRALAAEVRDQDELERDIGRQVIRARPILVEHCLTGALLRQTDF